MRPLVYFFWERTWIELRCAFCVHWGLSARRTVGMFPRRSNNRRSTQITEARMQNRSTALPLIAIFLAIVYVSFFTDWFRKKTIQIFVQHRPIPQKVDAKRGLEEAPVFPISFAFDGKYELTMIKVTKSADLKSEQFPTPVWHLIATTNSRPMKAIVYGVAPPGMHPPGEDALPQPLVAGADYTLVIQAGARTGTTTFVPIKATLTR